MRDKLRELECEYPPLKYKVICNSEQMYSLCVHGFLRDIANDAARAFVVASAPRHALAVGPRARRSRRWWARWVR